MGIFRQIGKVTSHLVDVRADKWVGYDYLRQSFTRTSYLISDLFKVERPTHQETFAEAVERLGLTEEIIASRKREFFRLTIAFLVIAACVFSYAIYLAIQQSFVACLIAFLFTLYSLAQAFRFHFWYFQMKHRKLGCNFREWLNGNPATDHSLQDPSEGELRE